MKFDLFACCYDVRMPRYACIYSTPRKAHMRVRKVFAEFRANCPALNTFFLPGTIISLLKTPAQNIYVLHLPFMKQSPLWLDCYKCRNSPSWGGIPTLVYLSPPIIRKSITFTHSSTPLNSAQFNPQSCPFLRRNAV